MGRHAKPHSPKDQPAEPQEGADQEENHASRGKHAAAVAAKDEK
ncbi:hypothetical protein ACFLIM_22615 [Nonomuraea sp. M3C6]|uniref:Uncharacterized protein n=1 Tax=Nonomuraea marmarensis TaxID=3351344 RepID=A0ABW7AF50_9ACTN